MMIQSMDTGGSDERSSSRNINGIASTERIQFISGGARTQYSRTAAPASSSAVTHHHHHMIQKEWKQPPLAGLSKNLVQDRRRQKRLNEKLDSLRTFVPIISKLDVARMDDQVYNLHILLKKSSRILVQLTRALESLQFGILNANFMVVKDHIINTLIIEVESGHPWKCEEIQQMALNTIPKYGFFR